jgi:hypothetical protein
VVVKLIGGAAVPTTSKEEDDGGPLVRRLPALREMDRQTETDIADPLIGLGPDFRTSGGDSETHGKGERSERAEKRELTIAAGVLCCRPFLIYKIPKYLDKVVSKEDLCEIAAFPQVRIPERSPE